MFVQRNLVRGIVLMLGFLLSPLAANAQVSFGFPGGSTTCNDGTRGIVYGGGIQQDDCDEGDNLGQAQGIFFGATDNVNAATTAVTSISGSGAVKIGGGLEITSTANPINFGGNVIHGVANPVVGTDAANKAYVDGIAAANNTKNTEQDNRLTSVETKNTQQDGRLTAVEDTNTQQNTRLTSVETKNTQQDTRLTSVENTNTAQQVQINNLQDTAGSLQRQVDALGERDEELADGIAVSLALQQPILLSGQSFGIRVGYGNFDGTSAVGATAAGVVNRGALGAGSSIVLDGGVGFGAETGGVSSRGGMTFAW